MSKVLSQTLRAGLRYLAKHQEADGSFLNFAGPYKSLDTTLPLPDIPAQRSVFATALISLFLRNLSPNPILTDLQHNLTKFLVAQRSPVWTWNYWQRTAAEYKQYPYPDDLDVTTCSLAALFHQQPELFTGETLATTVQMLTQLETQEGGPYRTWIVPETAGPVWRDVDIAVNANIAYFLSLLDVRLEPLQTYLSQAIHAKKFTTPYYPSVYPVIYFLSRTCTETEKQLLKSTLLKLQNSHHTWGNPLNTALSMLTLLEIDPNLPASSLKNAAAALHETQQHDGSWPGFIFYTGAKLPEDTRSYGAGSPYLTTAVCLAALHALEQRKQHPARQTNETRATPPQHHQAVYTSIQHYLHQAIEPLPPELKSIGTQLIKHTLYQDEQSLYQISLLPAYFHQAAGKKLTPQAHKLLTQLGVANVLGWIAYTAYDDFLDEEGKPERLSFAHWCLRHLTEIYLHLDMRNAQSFHHIFHQLMTDIDEANTWEVRHCRLPKTHLQLSQTDPAVQLDNFVIPSFGKLTPLANRSIGHALGPLALLYSWGHTEKSAAFQHTLQFFRHYLITRQLNDDAHDWETDLQRGHVNAASSALLQEYQSSQVPEHTSSLVSFKALGQLFWHSTILKLTKLMRSHARAARRSLRQNPILRDTTFFERLLEPLEHSTKLAETERAKALEFLAKYI